jgi:uncharacterized protein YbaP (TraB family)
MLLRNATSAIIATLLLLVGSAKTQSRAADTPVPALDELVVTGERPGPGMWHVHRGDAHVWILGSLSPLPKGITWRAKQVDQLLDSTQQVLVQKPFDIGIPRILWLLITERSVLLVTGGKRLGDVLPANLYARFAAARAKYSGDARKWERYRPIIATAFLQQTAFHEAGLSLGLDLGAAVRGLAKKHHIRVEEIKMAGAGDLVDTLRSLPAAAENACVEASLVTIESGLPRLVDRAEAWANGNVERLANLPEPKEIDACRASLEAGAGAHDLIASMRRTWLNHIESNLQQSGTSIAVVNLDLVMERGGLLDELRAKGFEIDSP